jgi:ribosomal protein L32
VTQYSVPKECPSCGVYLAPDRATCIACGVYVGPEAMPRIVAPVAPTFVPRGCSYCGVYLAPGRNDCIKCGRYVQAEVALGVRSARLPSLGLEQMIRAGTSPPLWQGGTLTPGHVLTQATTSRHPHQEDSATLGWPAVSSPPHRPWGPELKLPAVRNSPQPMLSAAHQAWLSFASLIAVASGIVTIIEFIMQHH